MVFLKWDFKSFLNKDIVWHHDTKNDKNVITSYNLIIKFLSWSHGSVHKISVRLPYHRFLRWFLDSFFQVQTNQFLWSIYLTRCITITNFIFFENPTRCRIKIFNSRKVEFRFCKKIEHIYKKFNTSLLSHQVIKLKS